MQVINPNRASDQLWQKLGTGLQQIAQSKLEQVQRQHKKAEYAQGVEPVVGRSIAQLLSNLGPEERKGAWKNPGGLIALGRYLDSRNAGQQGKPGQEGAAGLGALSNQQPESDEELSKLLQGAFTSPRDRIAQETLELKKESAAQKQQAGLKPFLDERNKNYRADKKIKVLAKRMLENIGKNKARFPGSITGNLPREVQNVLIRDPHVRKYMADTNSLVKLLANADTRGQITNAKLKLEEFAKANVGMPIETQEEILRDILEGVDRGERSIKQMNKLKNKETGRYPEDLQDKLTEFDLAQESPLEYPQYYASGTEYTDDDGTEYVNKDSKEWVPKGA